MSVRASLAIEERAEAQPQFRREFVFVDRVEE
jgi:hypothetical protein